MARFRTRPAEVEAVQWRGDNYPTLSALVEAPVQRQPGGALSFMTVAGTVQVERGEWLVRDADGRLAVMSDAEFTDAYEPVG